MVMLDKSEFVEWKTKDNYYYSETKKLLDFYKKKILRLQLLMQKNF